MFKHGLSNHPLYRRWESMRGRCNNPNDTMYRFYGAYGIKVCDEWNDFKKFYDWSIENGFKRELEIDRINYDGNYEPSNCRWVTLEVNRKNVRPRNRNKPEDWGLIKLYNGSFNVRIRQRVGNVSKICNYGTYKDKQDAIKVRDKAEQGLIEPFKLRKDKGIYEKPWGFVVHVVWNKKCHHVGTFKTKEEAMQERDHFTEQLSTSEQRLKDLRNPNFMKYPSLENDTIQ